MVDVNNSGKGRRLAAALGFVSGVLACLDAFRDARVDWPPAAAWQVLSHPKRLELAGGVALVLITLITSTLRSGRRS